jgi:hypothetical protein
VTTGVRQAAIVIGTVVLATAALRVVALGADRQISPETAAQGDAAAALHVLAAARGASSLACELMVAVLSPGWRGGFERHPDSPANFLPQVHWILQRSTDPARVVPLRRALDDPDPCVRRIAPRLLARSDHPRAVEALSEALRGPNPAARRAAAVGLGYASDPRTVDALRNALGDEHSDVRRAAAWALDRLSGTAPQAPAPIPPGRRDALARSAEGGGAFRPREADEWTGGQGGRADWRTGGRADTADTADRAAVSSRLTAHGS